ncbi:MAG: hypothetical protein Q4F65_04705 [Propionibacteriaceae bacterium]|nr:hypothetical protein [Propionibacteriaceae bacterium]
MTDAPLDPRIDPRNDLPQDHLDDVDAPRDRVPEGDDPVVNLDAPAERPGEEETSDDKYINVVDGRPETLGAETQDGPGLGQPDEPAVGQPIMDDTVQDQAGGNEPL